MAIVTVPAEFFRAELRVYGNWREAFAREVLQNSADAGATRIDVHFSTTPAGQARVVFNDDGHGMSREVLEEVFFALGRTTKGGPDTIGGFGRARIIICFAQRSYTIRTGNLLVEGSGGQYTITDVADWFEGCSFTVDLIDDSPERLRQELQWLVWASNMTMGVYVDGSRVTPGEALPDRATRILRDAAEVPWARVYARPNGGGSVRVQVRGLAMFQRSGGGADDVVVELVTARAREVLTASRDQLHGPYAEQLDEFVSNLSSNRRAALGPQAQSLDVRVGGGGFLSSSSPAPAEAPLPERHAEPAIAAAGPTPPRGARLGAPAAAPAAPTAGTSVASGLGFDVFLLADTLDTRTRRLARTWSPAAWTPRNGVRRRALLLTWKAAVTYVLDTLVAQRPELERVSWTVGWVFDADMRAVHRLAGQGHILALNPVDEGGRCAFRTTSSADRRRLLALAAHEACHVIAAHHDERFAGLLTDLYAGLDPLVADRAMRTAAH